MIQFVKQTISQKYGKIIGEDENPIIDDGNRHFAVLKQWNFDVSKVQALEIRNPKLDDTKVHYAYSIVSLFEERKPEQYPLLYDIEGFDRDQKKVKCILGRGTKTDLFLFGFEVGDYLKNEYESIDNYASWFRYKIIKLAPCLLNYKELLQTDVILPHLFIVSPDLLCNIKVTCIGLLRYNCNDRLLKEIYTTEFKDIGATTFEYTDLLEEDNIFRFSKETIAEAKKLRKLMHKE